MTKPFAKVRSSAIDGRAQNPFYRKNQLRNLHSTLADKATEIQDAIGKDTRHRPAEVKIEYWLALQAIADGFNSIDPAQCLEDEYAIAKARDDLNSPAPVGIVVIEPSSHAFFYSLIAALVPALTAGNSTKNSLLETPRLVLGLIQEALDQDIFEVTNQEATAADINHRHLRIRQNGSPGPALRDDLISDPKTRVVAFVERDADIRLAAKAITSARFGLRGRSPYAPDVVLVNEWVKKDLLRALLQESTDFLSGPTDSRNKEKVSKPDLLKEIEKEGSANVLSSGSNGAIVDAGNRDSFLLKRKVTEGCLIIHSVSSMDDAIDVSKRAGPLAAAYVFTTPAMAKYLCQFIDSAACFVNQIPVKLMYSPVAPLGHPPQPNSYGIYQKSLFAMPAPKYITTSRVDDKLSSLIGQPSPQQLRLLEQEATKKLQEVVRLKKAGGIGFFQQGIVTGLVLMLTTLASGAGIVGYYGFKYWRARSSGF
ncbi:hypothetical protein ACJ41O_010986 [Fusarium nematophilum]